MFSPCLLYIHTGWMEDDRAYASCFSALLPYTYTHTHRQPAVFQPCCLMMAYSHAKHERHASTHTHTRACPCFTCHTTQMFKAWWWHGLCVCAKTNETPPSTTWPFCPSFLFLPRPFEPAQAGAQPSHFVAMFYVLPCQAAYGHCRLWLCRHGRLPEQACFYEAAFKAPQQEAAAMHEYYAYATVPGSICTIQAK